MPDLLRMLDANMNRAREALRCMEDVARFVLEDAALASDLKSARHELRALSDHAGLNPATLAAWRDTPNDPGTSLSTTTERERRNAADIAIAAAKRATEALRAIEECLKSLPGGADARAKALRYRLYDLEKRLTLALGSAGPRQWRLCVLITEALCARPWDEVAESALRGGADAIQLREKTLPDAELLGRARRLVHICRPHHAASVINDRPDIALLAGADAVHLGQDDLHIHDARKLVGTKLLIGVSTTNMQQARRASADGADMCGCGPMFATTTKHKPTLAGPEYLAAYLADPATARIPHLAIGGISAANLPALVGIGCRGLAVSSAVCASPDPGAACREILGAMKAAVAETAA